MRTWICYGNERTALLSQNWLDTLTYLLLFDLINSSLMRKDSLKILNKEQKQGIYLLGMIETKNTHIKRKNTFRFV